VETTLTRRGWNVDLALDPDDRLDAALTTTLDDVRGWGGGTVTVWVHEPDDATDALLRNAGFARWRDLHQLRRPLPIDAADDLDTRAFVPGQDEAAWLEVNNRAFAWHPEQSDWSLDELCAREADDWFDPEGFLLHEIDGTLAGFCWTKVHAATDPPLGEIYVIGVDPAFQGRGLGKSLTLAGLRYLAAQGVITAMLYVESDNEPALALYDRLGFTLHHVDRAYVGEVPAS
jgi:mycothiol synthase